MPVYEYICQKCQLKFDYLVRSSQDEIVCPRCNRKDLKRLISTFSFSSKDAGGNTTGSSGGCGGCASHNCSTCHG